jgi:hypothetical protein
MTEQNLNTEPSNSTKPVLPLVVGGLTEEAIEIIARKQALVYSYENEYQYLKFVKAIKEGIKIGLKNGKNI